MTDRRVPAVAYTMPLTMIGVPSSLFSGRGPTLSVLKRQATSILLKLLALIWSSGEYLLPRRSAVYIGHSPFFVLGCPVAWPATCGCSQTSPAPRRTSAGIVRVIKRDMLPPVEKSVWALIIMLFARFQARSFDDFDARAGWSGHVREVDRRPVR